MRRETREETDRVLRMAEALGREVRSEELGDDWIEVTFSERGDA